MNEFVEKLIGRLEEINHTDYGSLGSYESHVAVRDCLRDVKEIVNQLAEEYNNSNDSMEIQIAKNYAKWLTKCGVNVTEKWLTATEQEYALNEAYMRGIQDVIDKFAEWQNEHNNGWIPCSEKMPKECQKVWLSFTSQYTSFVKSAWWVNDHFEWNNGRTVKDVPLAWKPYNVPAPYQPKGE